MWCWYHNLNILICDFFPSFTKLLFYFSADEFPTITVPNLCHSIVIQGHRIQGCPKSISILLILPCNIIICKITLCKRNWAPLPCFPFGAHTEFTPILFFQVSLYLFRISCYKLFIPPVLFLPAHAARHRTDCSYHNSQACQDSNFVPCPHCFSLSPITSRFPQPCPAFRESHFATPMSYFAS